MQEFSMQAITQVREWLNRSPELNPGPHPARQHLDVSGWRFEMKEAQMGGRRVRIGFCLELGMIICPEGIDPFQAAQKNQQSHR
jgi:hypothetical protein